MEINKSINQFITSLFPFYIEITQQNNIVACGISIIKLFPGLVGADFNSTFSIVRPSVERIDFNFMIQHQEELIILRNNHNSELMLRGQFKYEITKNTIFFLGSPWIMNPLQLKETGLTFKDFSLTDNLVELLSLSEKYEHILKDTNYLLGRINEKNILIEKEKERYNNIINSLDEIIFQTDIEGNWTFLNFAWEKATGHTVKESVNTPIFNHIHPNDVENCIALYNSLINRKINHCSSQFRCITKNKELKWLLIHASLILDENNNAIGTTGTLLDITNEIIKENQLELIVNNIYDELSLVDMEGNYIMASPSLIKNRGYDSFEDFKRNNAKTNIHPDDHIDYEPLLTKSDGIEYELRIKNKSGAYKWYGGSVKKIRDSITQKDYLINICRNIEHIKKAQFQQEQALVREQELNKMKTNFITTSSHEFKTPIAIIKTNIEILINSTQNNLEGNLQAVHIKYLNSIENEAERMLELINDTLILEKANNSSIEFKPAKLNVFTLLLDIAERFNHFQKDNRKIILDIIGNPKNIYADKELLDIVFQNLASNAFKYSVGKKEPIIIIEFKDEFVEISFKDFGIGIPENDLNKLFLPFSRASNTYGIAGTGMGLSIAKTILVMHNAPIEISSIQHIGTVVKTRFPYTLQ